MFKTMICFAILAVIFAGCRQNTPEAAEGVYMIRNDKGMEATFSAEGARLMHLLVPARDGKPTDVVVGFDSVNQYRESTEPYFGATIGRYGNRIAGGQFVLDSRFPGQFRGNGHLYTNISKRTKNGV